MNAKELSELISQHASVPSTFIELAEWAQKAQNVALKPDIALQLPDNSGLFVTAYMTNKSERRDSLLGCIATAAAQGDRPKETLMAQTLPSELALDGWQYASPGLRLKPGCFLRLAMLFPVFQCVKDRARSRPDFGSYRDAFTLRVETLAKSHTPSPVTVYTPEGLRESIKKRLNP